MAKVVEIEDVTVSYRENIALKKVTLNIEEGTFLAVIGPNGAGKTTLLTAINGLGKIVQGKVKVFGIDFTPGALCRIRKEIGYVPQTSSIDPRFPVSVQDVVMMGRIGRIGIFRYPDPEDYRIVEEIMELVEIIEFKERPIGHLSGGEQQKVAIARALAQEPKIMLLDEPTTNLDLKSQRNIVELIDKIYKKKNLTMVLVTHLLNHIPSSCKKALLIKEGRIVWKGERSSLNEELLSNLYDCPVELIRKGERVLVEPKWN